MTGTYAMGAPWLRPNWHHVGGGCGPEGRLGAWLAAMTGARTHPGMRGGPWSVFGGGGGFPMPPWGGPGRGWRGPKARRGDVRAAILAVLAEEPRNGYQIISEIAERSGGAWKPSPGSVYPNLQQLEDEGLVVAETEGSRRTYRLTDEGRTYVAEHAEEVAAPWEAMAEMGGGSDDAEGLRPLVGQAAAAIWQIMQVGTPEQQARAREAITELRRRLYAILSEDER